MEIVRAIVLGAVQGLTEFLPISSSGHLILVREAFDWPDNGLAFDVGLHLGTLLALLAYFSRDWVRMAASGVRNLRARGVRLAAYEGDGRLLLLLALGTVPAGIAGLLLDGWIESNVRQAWIVALTLIGFGIVLLLSDRMGTKERSLGSVGLKDAIVVGIAQAFALIPGVSRSGVTISAALGLGFERETAARFAFLLGTPAFVGAGILKAADLAGAGEVDPWPLVAGFLTSLIVGLLAVHWLLGFLRQRSVEPFVVYRVALGALTLLLVALA
ncbi:MAG: undecaprenyl-diphosphatase UppP [Dehalococcoidia bacterium]